MPSYMYPYTVYPNYLSGVGYLMSLNVALKLYEEAFNIPIIHMEDVYITGIYNERDSSIERFHVNLTTVSV